MNRWTFLNAMCAIAFVGRGTDASVADDSVADYKEIAGIRVPDTPVAREATRIARSTEPVEIFNHSLRTYLFAQLIGKAKGIQHDVELVYVASILHDTGMSSKFMSDRNPFEVDGADVARKLLASHGISESRQQLAWDAVALHDNGGIAQHKQPEVLLVNAGVGADFGAYLDELTRTDIIAVLKAAPRAHFIDVFMNAAAAVAKKKPLACAHSFVADVGYCKVPGFRLPSFCDAVKEDPFANFTS